jgi:hypothetical protein
MSDVLKNGMTQQELQQVVIYCNGALYWRTHQFQSLVGRKLGSLCKGGTYRRVYIGCEMFEHHVVWFYHTGNLVRNLDHINRDGTDNRIENLRLADKVAQTANRRTISVRKTKCGRYEARVQVAGKRVSLGSFATQEAAEAAYKQKHIETYGNLSPFYEVTKCL